MSILPEINWMYEPEKPITCNHCHWEGRMKDCIEKRYVSSYESWQQLSGRDGWQYFCPNCNWLITSIWNRVS